ncbi:MAG: hypothetical protein JWO46_2938 [Nocardioidaceae bacterium]|nr:hypothetical protein [Nocardioidaceae bacterium]
MTSPRRRVTALLTAALLGLVVAGCGGSSSGEPSKRRTPGLAAEPATSPALTAAPEGTTSKVGALPQGIVYDATTDQLAVAVRDPYRLVVLDPTTLIANRSVEIPGKVRHLQLVAPGGPVLVPSETANTLFEVPLDGGPVTSTKVPEHPHDAAAGNGFVMSGNEFDGSISFIKNGQIAKTVGDLKQPGGVVADGEGHVAVVDVGAFTVTTYDLKTLTRTARVPAGAGPTHGVLTGPNRLAVTDTRGGKLLLYSIDPLKQIGSIDLPGSPYGLTADPTTGTVWVTLTATNKLVGYDVSSAEPRLVAEYDTVQQPDTVAVAPGNKVLWVTGTKDGVVQRIRR